MADLPQYGQPGQIQLPRYPLPGQESIQQIGQIASTVPPNILSGIGPGIQSGFSMGLQARQQQRLEEQARQEADLARKRQAEKDFDSFGQALKNLKGMPPKLKSTYFDNIFVPRAQAIGLDVSPGYDPSIDDP